MKAADHDIFSLIAHYEREITEAAGMPISMVRFAASFFASVAVGLLLKFVPTAKGAVSLHLLRTRIQALLQSGAALLTLSGFSFHMSSRSCLPA